MNHPAKTVPQLVFLFAKQIYTEVPSDLPFYFMTEVDGEMVVMSCNFISDIAGIYSYGLPTDRFPILYKD
jgi:hypothetical protein